MLVLVRLGQQGSTGGRLEDLADAIVGSSRALEVLVRSDLLANFLALGSHEVSGKPNLPSANWGCCKNTYLLGSNRLLGGLLEFLDGLGVVAKVLLAANQDDGKTLAEVKNLGDPLEATSVGI